jgi:hypothetical protein
MTHIDPKRSAAGVDSHEPVIHDAAPVLSGSKARQAPPGRRALLVLVAGLVLAIIAWAAVEFLPSESSRVTNAGGSSTVGTATGQPTAGGIPLSPPVGSPEGSASQGQASPSAVGRGGSPAPSPSSDSAR